MRADDGAELWAERSGDGPPLVLCHGGPGLWDMFDGLLPLRGETAVIRWDQRGCGRSDRSVEVRSLTEAIADLDAVRRHFGLERMALLGHSWGAQLALFYALEHPHRVSRLVYVSGTGIDVGSPWKADYRANLRRRVGPDLGSVADERERCILQWSADVADAEQLATPWFGVNFAANARLGADMTALLASDLRPRCECLPVPTLIIDGADDIRPRWAVDSLADALPVVRRVIIPGAAHFPWLDAPDAFAAGLS